MKREKWNRENMPALPAIVISDDSDDVEILKLKILMFAILVPLPFWFWFSADFPHTFFTKLAL